MAPVRHRSVVAAVLTAAALLTGCGGGALPLSLADLTETADGVPEDGAGTCPLPYDMAKAAGTAGLDGKIGPGSAQKDYETPVATAEGGKRAKAGDPLAENPGVLVSCTFHIGQEDVQVHTIATSKPHAILYLAPVISPLTGASVNNSINYVTKAAEAKAGEMTVADSGNVAAVRLKLDGEGDAALLAGVGEAGAASPSRKQVADLAKALADQVQ
ncbi:hypothetical protein ACFWOL_14570 [Streptomyces sp. NPDC058442]|uniref:hypothetical protein n=1 Tax=Streptomyces sp. NPDC058442 TaxID=3346503 RepID=UPI003651311C